MADSYAEIVEQYKALGRYMRDQQNLTKQDLKAIGEKAKALYNEEHYEEALELFALLLFMEEDYKRSHFTFLIACCLHKMRRYSEAASMYQCWTSISLLDKPHLCKLVNNTLLNDCYQNMSVKEIEECKNAL
jgi:tetratricopeptide (TPR) repeat protein